MFIVSYLAHLGNISYFCSTIIGKWEVKARRDKTQRRQTFAGRYLFLDFRDCLPKWRYACYYLAMLLSIVGYGLLLVILVYPREPFYRQLLGYTYRSTLILNVVPAIASFLPRRSKEQEDTSDWEDTYERGSAADYDDTARKTPPLSLLDAFIYLALIGIWLFIAFRLLDMQYALWEQIRFPNRYILAVNPYPGELAAVPLMFVVGIGPFCLLLTGLMTQRPIFGNPKIQYGDMPWKRNLYPLFGAIRPVKKRAKPHSRRKILSRVVSVFLAAAVMLFGYTVGIFCRDSLFAEGAICLIRYDSLNQAAETYSVMDIASMTIKSVSQTPSEGRGQREWGYAVEFQTEDGKGFSFSSTARSNPFLTDTFHTAMLERLLEIKAVLPPDAVRIEGKDDVQFILEAIGYENYLLLDLFDVPYVFVDPPTSGLSKFPNA